MACISAGGSRGRPGPHCPAQSARTRIQPSRHGPQGRCPFLPCNDARAQPPLCRPCVPEEPHSNPASSPAQKGRDRTGLCVARGMSARTLAVTLRKMLTATAPSTHAHAKAPSGLLVCKRSCGARECGGACIRESAAKNHLEGAPLRRANMAHATRCAARMTTTNPIVDPECMWPWRKCRIRRGNPCGRDAVLRHPESPCTPIRLHCASSEPVLSRPCCPPCLPPDAAPGWCRNWTGSRGNSIRAVDPSLPVRNPKEKAKVATRPSGRNDTRRLTI